MEQNRNLLFSDIDGTLIRQDQTISDAVAAALRKMARAGHGLILSSGRPLESILGILSYLESRMEASFPIAMIIANNGAQIYDCRKGVTISEKRIPLPLIDQVQHLADTMGVHLQTYSDTHIICHGPNAETDFYTRKIHLPVQPADVFTKALTKPPYKMLAISLAGDEALLPFREKLLACCGEQLQCFFSGKGYLEIVRKDTDKGNALRFVAEHLGLPLTHTFAAGDSENDLSMILAAGCGFVMAGANDAVKARCQHVTQKTCGEDGILEVIAALL